VLVYKISGTKKSINPAFVW